MSAKMKIYDAHHHLWNLHDGNHDWLNGEDTTFCEYRAADYLTDMAQFEFVGSTVVEAAATDVKAEAIWLNRELDELPGQHSIVAGCRLESDIAEEDLHILLNIQKVKGIRQMLDWHPDYSGLRRPPLLDCKIWRRNLQLVIESGLLFEIQIMPDQVNSVCELVARHPDGCFVLNHAGARLPLVGDARNLWLTGMRELSLYANVYVKLSGFAEVDPNWGQPVISQLIQHLLECFGPERLMFGSNFPIEKTNVTFSETVQKTLCALEELSDHERQAIMSNTALAVYS